MMTNILTIGFVALAGVYGLSLAVGPNIETQIEIDAPADKVWGALMDFDAYGDWNPFIREISGNAEIGETLNVFIQPQGQDGMRFTPEVLAAEANSELRWVGRLGVPGVFDGEHAFKLRTTPNGTTIFEHSESFRGVLAFPLIAMIYDDTKSGFEQMNLALKARVEEDLAAE